MCVASTCKRVRRNARLNKRDRRMFATKHRAIRAAATPVKAKAKKTGSKK